MTMPETIWAWDDFEGNAPRAGDWCDEKSECPDCAVEYVLRSSVQAMIDAAIATPPDADTRVVTLDMLREAIGRAWCHEENVAKEFDVDLAEAVLWQIRGITKGKDHE